ncbi:MAG: hypothetical protein ACLVA2_02975 [Clostridia bacterium]
MKKFIIFLVVILIIIATVSYIYLDYKVSYDIAKKENYQFESYYNQEIFGPDVATVINKAVDKNSTNNISKDNKGNFIENDTNSIKIDIKFLDDDKTHKMEEIFNNGIGTFMQYYSQIKFKCTKIEYHRTTKKVRYMLFEQITK